MPRSKAPTPGQISTCPQRWPSAATQPWRRRASRQQVTAGQTGSVTGNSFIVSWTAPTDTGTSAISDYDVRYYAGSAPPHYARDWIEADEMGGHDHVGTATQATLAGLTKSTTYWVQVRASNDDGPGEWSDAAGATTTNGATVSTLVSNDGQDETGNLTNLSWSTSPRAQLFTTGSDTNGYKLTALHLRLVVQNPNLADPDYTVSIRPAVGTGASAVPGDSVGELAKPSSLASGINVFTAPGDGIFLDPNTEYFVHVDATRTAGRKGVKFVVLSSNAEDAGAAAGWSIANGMHLFVSGDGWRGAPNATRIVVRGHADEPLAGTPGAPTGVTTSTFRHLIQPHGELGCARQRRRHGHHRLRHPLLPRAAPRRRSRRSGSPPASPAATTTSAPRGGPPLPTCWTPEPPTRCRCGRPTRSAPVPGRPPPPVPLPVVLSAARLVEQPPNKARWTSDSIPWVESGITHRRSPQVPASAATS